MSLTANKALRVFGILILATSMTGCSMLKNIGGGGKNKEKFSPDKERIAILTGENNLEVDATLANTPVVLPNAYRNKSWTQTGGNASKAIYHLEIGDKLTQVWRRNIGNGNGNYQRLAAGPVAAGGVVYAMDIDADVTAVDLATGRILWTKDLDNKKEKSKVGFGGGVAYWNGSVYATTGYGYIVSLDAKSGSENWRYDGSIPLRNAPTVTDGRLFAVTQDNRILAFDANTGTEIWDQVGITETATMYGAASPAIDGETIVVALSSGELMALRTQNGRLLWQDSLSRTNRLTPLATLADIDASPVIDRGRVYAVSHAGRMVSIDMRSGQRAWEGNVASVNTPLIAGDYGFVVTVDAEIACIALTDGRIRWTSQIQKFEDQKKRRGLISWTAPVLAGDRLFIASSHGYLLSISPYTGEVLSGKKLSGGVTTPPIVVDGTLVLLNEDGDLIAFR
jgi:outer membrane protein assembly factor BamB